MSRKRPINPPEIQIKKNKLLTQQEKFSVSEWLNTTEKQAIAVTLQQPTAKGVLLLNCSEQPLQTTLHGQILHRMEQEVFSEVEKQQNVGRIMKTDEICQLACTIHTQLLETETEQQLLKMGRVLDGDKAIHCSFDADEKWFQQFCKRYMPWREHLDFATLEPINNPANNTNLKPATLTKSPIGAANIGNGIKTKQNKQSVLAVKTNDVTATKGTTANTLRDIQPTLKSKRMAREFISDFHKLITEGNYLPQQVFNAAEMFLNWKLMPKCTKLYKTDRYEKGQDRLSLLFCGNASGDFLVKPMYLHHTYSPQMQDDSLLSLYIGKTIPYAKKDRIRSDYFFDWLQTCFIPEVRDFLQVKDLPAKALLLIDPALLDGQSDLPVSAEDDLVKFLYFPDKTASLLQPLSMTVMPTFACNYLSRLLSAMMANSMVDYGRSFNDLWEHFAMVDSFKMIQHSIEEITAECWNSGWETMWKKIVEKPFDQNLITAAIERIAAVGRQIPAVGFRKITSEEIETHLKTNPSLLPAFQALSAGTNHLNWLDSDNDSDLDETVTDLEKNPFLLKSNNLGSEVDEEDKEEALTFESVTVACNPLQENNFNSELHSPTSTLGSRLPSISDCETPNTPEFDLSACASDISSPALSESNLELLDIDYSVPRRTKRNFSKKRKQKSCDIDNSVPRRNDQYSQNTPELKNLRNMLKEKSFIAKIDDLSKTLKSIPEKLNGVQAVFSLHRKLNVVVNELNNLRSQCVQIEKKAQPRITPSMLTLYKKPFETAKEFFMFDENLRRNPEMQEQMTSYFSSKLKGKLNLFESIEQIWRGALTDKVAFEYVWKGCKNNEKIPVKHYKFSQLLQSLFIAENQGSPDFESICEKTFISAHNRWRKVLSYRRGRKKND